MRSPVGRFCRASRVSSVIRTIIASFGFVVTPSPGREWPWREIEPVVGRGILPSFYRRGQRRARKLCEVGCCDPALCRTSSSGSLRRKQVVSQRLRRGMHEAVYEGERLMQRSELRGLWRVVGQLNGPSTSAPIVNAYCTTASAFSKPL